MKKIVGYFEARGGGNEIGKSMYTLTFLEEKTIFIIDCGIQLKNSAGDNVILPKMEGLDPTWKIYVFFSHGHNDHIGMAAKLKILYPNAAFFSTEPTQKIIGVMGNDAIKIRLNNGLPLHFNCEDLDKLLNAIRVVRSSDWINLGNGFRVRFEPSGHIRGAAIVLIETPYGIFLYSGDINFSDTATVRGAQKNISDKIRWLAIESTNGDLALPDPKTEFQKMKKDSLEITGNGGHIMIPSFALGRGPDIGIGLGRELDPEKIQLFMGGLIKKTAHACHHSHWESDIPFAGETDDFGFHLEKENIRWIHAKSDQLIRALNGRRPSIFVVPHGMIQAGISLALFRTIAQNPKNAIFFPGFQAEETNGRRLLNLKTGEEFTVKYPTGIKKSVRVLARVNKYQISGHADGFQLADWVQNMDPHDGQSLDITLLVHGDQKGQVGLYQKLQKIPKRPKEILIGTNNRLIPLYSPA